MIILDVETRTHKSVKEYGVDAHLAPDAGTICTMAGLAPLSAEGPVDIWVPGHTRIPEALLDPDQRFIAHNCRYDRLVWNKVLRRDFPELPEHPREHWYDSAVVARANGWPSKLDACLRIAGLPRKKTSVIVNRTFDYKWPLADYDPEDRSWSLLREYLEWDVDGLRRLVLGGFWDFPSEDDWAEFWACEDINDRGLPVDKDLVENLRKQLEVVMHRFHMEFTSITGCTVTQTQRINKWVAASVPDHVRTVMTNDEGKLTLDKRDGLPAVIAHPDTPPLVREALVMLSECRKSSVSKLSTMLDRRVDGVVRGSYIFCGASATGRFSSTGLQAHNMPKECCDPEFVSDVALPVGEFLSKYSWRDVPAMVSTALRPVVHKSGSKVVWSDWSAIEACILPWLTLDRRAESRLNVFRSRGDIYMHTVEEMFGPQEDRSKRKLGKVLELALGFLGGVGALDTFSRNFGIVLGEQEKQDLVYLWRRRNPWAVDFGDELFAAFNDAAVDQRVTQVGRIVLQPSETQAHTVEMVLPDGRPIVYPDVRVRWRGTTFAKYLPNGSAQRYDVWRGLLAENATQGTAASLLRSKLAKAVKVMDVRGSTHDEIIALAPACRAEETAVALARLMVEVPDWLKDCPLNAEWAYGDRYGHAERTEVV